QPTPDIPKILDYIAPYLNIRSTLFLPLSDAPWLAGSEAAEVTFAEAPMVDVSQPPGGDGQGDVNGTSVEGAKTSAAMGGSQDMDKTMVFGDNEKGGGGSLARPGEDDGALTVASPQEDLRVSGQKRMVSSLTMGALVPLRLEGGNVGVAFLERI